MFWVTWKAADKKGQKEAGLPFALPLPCHRHPTGTTRQVESVLPAGVAVHDSFGGPWQRRLSGDTAQTQDSCTNFLCWTVSTPIAQPSTINPKKVSIGFVMWRQHVKLYQHECKASGFGPPVYDFEWYMWCKKSNLSVLLDASWLESRESGTRKGVKLYWSQMSADVRTMWTMWDWRVLGLLKEHANCKSWIPQAPRHQTRRFSHHGILQQSSWTAGGLGVRPLEQLFQHQFRRSFLSTTRRTNLPTHSQKSVKSIKSTKTGGSEGPVEAEPFLGSICD